MNRNQHDKGTFDCETEIKKLLHLYSSIAMQKKPKLKQNYHDAAEPGPLASPQRFVRLPKKTTVL